MPLRDHFRPPLSRRRSWEELFGQWPGVMAQTLQQHLPPYHIAGPHIRPTISVAFDEGTSEPVRGWPPTCAVTTSLPDDVYEVRIHDLHRARQLVAAVELVSPGNKDRPAARAAFGGKCAAMIRAGVSVCVVDVVTEQSANLFTGLTTHLGHPDLTFGADAPGVYAASCRIRIDGPRAVLEAWAYPLAVGSPLPTLPLWLRTDLAIPLDLEASYEKACADLGIA